MEGSSAHAMGVPIGSILAHLRSHVKRLPQWESMRHLLGAKLRYLRHQHNMTQGELRGHLTLASPGYITNIETSKRVASIDLVLRIADFFKVTTDYLLCDDVPVEPKIAASTSYTASQERQLRLFGEKLRYLRIQAGLSQRDLAQRLSLASRAYISNLESGRKMPSLDLVVQIADLFGVTTDYLLWDTIPIAKGTTNNRVIPS
jgi:transcriptional regulator with XRE-family HTH domain